MCILNALCPPIGKKNAGFNARTFELGALHIPNQLRSMTPVLSSNLPQHGTHWLQPVTTDRGGRVDPWSAETHAKKLWGSVAIW